MFALNIKFPSSEGELGAVMSEAGDHFLIGWREADSISRERILIT